MLSIIAAISSPGPDDMDNVVRDSILELMTTTMFVYSGTLSVLSTGSYLVGTGIASDQAPKIMPIAFAFGISITTLAYSTGHLTGGHMNPAVSLMMYLKHKLSLKKMLCYWVAQFLGAMLGSALLWGGVSSANQYADVVGYPPLLLGSTTLNEGLSQGNGFLLELMGSFIFFFVISQTALDNRGIAGSYFPALAIGFSLVVVHIGLIPLTGCGVNPARTFGPSIVCCMASAKACGKVIPSSYWIYWIGPFLASALVAEVTYWMTDIDDNGESGNTPGKGEGPDTEAPRDDSMKNES